MATRMQQRRGTAAQWTAANPILAAGEIGFETDTSKFKMGNGSSTWSALQYFANAAELASILDGAPDLLNTLNELAAAVGDDPEFFTTTANSLALKAPLASPALTGTPTAPTASSLTNTTQIATTEFVQSKIGELVGMAPDALNSLQELADAINNDADFATGITNSLLTKASITYVDDEISALDTAAHGYADDAQTDATAAAATDATDKVSAHNSTTLNVHGIANTADLATQEFVTDLVGTVTGGYTQLAGVGLDWNADTEAFDVNNTIATAASLTAHNNETENVHGIADTTALATNTDVSDAVAAQALITTTEIGTHNSDTSNVHGIADTSALATHTDVSDAVAAQALLTTTEIGTHNSDTTNVHGIADTADLALLTDVSDAVSDHNDLTLNVHGIADTSALATTSATNSAISTAVSDHNSVTTNVHGIADTAALATKAYADTAEADAITAAGTAADTKIATAVAALTKSSVGLANVDNTSDADKPVSTATQTALDAKASLAGATFTGNVEVDGNLVVDGDLTVNGTNFSASATSITIEDNLVQLAHQNAANTVDLGIVVGYNDGAAKHSGIVRDVSADKWKLFKGVTTEPSTTVDFTQGSLDALQVGALEATTVTPSSGVVFSDGTQTKEGVASRTPIIAKTDSYTLSALTERDSLIEMNKSTAVTLTIPADSTIDYPVGTSIDILQTGAGQVTIAPVSGTVTVNATPGLKLRTTWSSATLFKRAANTWVVYGDLTA